MTIPDVKVTLLILHFHFNGSKNS